MCLVLVQSGLDIPPTKKKKDPLDRIHNPLALCCMQSGYPESYFKIERWCMVIRSNRSQVAWITPP